MKKNLLLLAVLVCFSSSILLAQQMTVTGKVTDAFDNQTLPGVTVMVKGKAQSTQTNSNGSYSIVAEQNDVLVFHFIGMGRVERTVTSAIINVSLESSTQGLEEVVVVGYGTQKKSHLTGAVASVDVGKVVGDRPVPDIARGLQGAVPGLSVTVPSGEVGGDPIMKIRGQVGSVLGNSNPLILVDNVEIPSINYVNPNDIESISVLKDAASSSIYGSKGAFGVILITTKKGTKADANSFTYSNNFIYQTPFSKIDVAGIDGIEYSLDAHENMNQTGPAGGFWRVDRSSFEKIKEWDSKYGATVGKYDPVVYGRDWYFDGVEKYGYRIYDPVDAMINDHASSNIHNLGMNGKSGNTSYNLSVGYLGQQGMMKPAKHDDFKRYTSTLTLETKVNDFLTLRGGARYADSKKRNPFSLNSAEFGADPWVYLYRWSRLFPTGVQENGKDIIDPVFSAKNSNDQITAKKYLNLNFGTTVDITKNWDVKGDYAYTSEGIENGHSVPFVEGKTHWYKADPFLDENGVQVYVDENGVPTNDILEGLKAYEFPMTAHATKAQTGIYKSSYLSGMHTFNATTNYKLDLDAHNLNFMLGTNIVSYSWESQFSQRGNLINNDNPQFNFATGDQTSGGGTNWDSQVGFFGRINYAYQDKYLFETSFRRDATSKFPTHLQWRSYPSVSGGWVISRENFMESLKPIVSFAKIRASYGSIGDQSVPNSLYLPQMAIGQNSWLASNGTKFFQMGTPGSVSGDITWQDIEHINIGADFRFFGNRLGFTGELFQRYTKNMIVGGDPLPATYGTSAPNGNYGNLRTRGWELNADYTHHFENGLRLSIDGNISDAVSYVTKGADWDKPWEDRTLTSTFSTGQRYGDVYGFVTDRLYQKDDFVYDANGDFVQTAIIYKGNSKMTNVLVGDNPVYQTYFEDGNQNMLISPGDVKFVDVNGDGYIDVGSSTNGDPGDRVVIGNSTPRYQYGFRLGAEFKGFYMSAFLQGVGKRSIWGDGQLAIPGYHVKDGAMPQAIAGNYWKEDRTDAFYPRAWHLGGSNSGYVMRPQSQYMLDMSYLKIKNITLGYELPTLLLNRAKFSSARIYVSLENFVTFDKLRGLPIDPEAVSGYSVLRSSGYNLGRTGTANPPFKSASVGIQIGF